MATRAISGGASAPPFAAALDVALAAIPLLPRVALAELVTHAIDRLDEIDGDPDLEDNGDAEECGDAEGPGAPGENWRDFLPDRPIYGVDQSRGPLNEVAAVQAYERRQRGLQ